MYLIDTHCHIHEDHYPINATEAIEQAVKTGVAKMIVVGTSVASSRRAVEFAREHDGVWCSIGQHPHEAKNFGASEQQAMEALVESSKLVAIGECGLDYWYAHSSKEDQERVLRWQLDLATSNNLPVIFHNRGSKDNPQDAFDDLWRILQDYPVVTGVIHSFSADTDILKQILVRGFAVGINGIMTFTKNTSQLEALDATPISKIVLETDAPFLTPPPFRGTINEPKHLVEVAKFVANRKGVSLDELADITSETASQIFKI